MIDKFPIMVIGLGRMGRAWIKALSMEGLEELTVTAMCDPDPGAGAIGLEFDGIPIFSTWSQALSKGEYSAAIVATPPGTHEEIVIDLLKEGIPVLCEKPLAPTVDGAKRMLEAARDQGVPLCMASKFRFLSDLGRTAQFLDGGLLGDVTEGRIEFSAPFNAEGGFHRERPPIGGIVADNCPHGAEIARMLLGPVRSVSATAPPKIQDILGNDAAWLHFRHESGALTTLYLNWNCPAVSPWYLTLQGKEGTLLAGWQGGRYKIHDAPDWVDFGSGYGKDKVLAAMALSFSKTLKGDGNYPISPIDALASVAVTEAALQALETGQIIDVRDDL